MTKTQNSKQDVKLDSCLRGNDKGATEDTWFDAAHHPELIEGENTERVFLSVEVLVLRVEGGNDYVNDSHPAYGPMTAERLDKDSGQRLYG